MEELGGSGYVEDRNISGLPTIYSPFPSLTWLSLPPSSTCQTWLDPNPVSVLCPCSAPDSQPRIKVQPILNSPRLWAFPVPPSH